ncbi:preprotein translocase subunit YajC [Candidatus Poribacteria bacterium]|nr:MAG: preprotein translocase subunit YajC [Candidatus Poribacteria bacterium]
MEQIGGLLVPFIAMGAIMYFLLWRPEQAKRKKHQNMLENLSKGDEIVTNGGLHGKILGLSNDKQIIVISVGEVNNQEVKVQIQRSAVAFVRKGGELIEGE